MTSERYERGAARLDQLAPGLRPRLEESMAAIAPDFPRWIVEFGYGDVHTRPGLDAKQRQLVVLGALAALGHPQLQLRAQVGVALSAGLTPDEIVEAILQATPFVGFPAATNALRSAHQVFTELGVSVTPAAAQEPA